MNSKIVRNLSRSRVPYLHAVDAAEGRLKIDSPAAPVTSSY